MNLPEALKALEEGHIIKHIDAFGEFCYYIYVTLMPLNIKRVYEVSLEYEFFGGERPEDLSFIKVWQNSDIKVSSLLSTAFSVISQEELLADLQKEWDNRNKAKL